MIDKYMILDKLILKMNGNKMNIKNNYKNGIKRIFKI
jgi:hypothetical protein